MQIEPFGGEDDASELFDRDRLNKGKYSGKWTNFLNLCTAKKGIGKGGLRGDKMRKEEEEGEEGEE